MTLIATALLPEPNRADGRARVRAGRGGAGARAGRRRRPPRAGRPRWPATGSSARSRSAAAARRRGGRRLRALGVAGDRVERPLAGDALEHVRPAVLELEARADDEVLDRAARRGPRRARAVACTRAARWTAIPARSSPTTSHSPVWMPARSSSPIGAAAVADGRARSGPRAPARRRSRARASPKRLDQRPRWRASSRSTTRSCCVEQLPPAAVAELGGVLGRAHDVGEEDRREHPLADGRGGAAGDELLDLVEHRVLVAGDEEVVRAGQLDARARWGCPRATTRASGARISWSSAR